MTPRLGHVLLLLAACGGGAGRIEVSSQDVAIGTYEDTLAPPTGISVTYPGKQLLVHTRDAAAAPWLSVDVTDNGGSAVIQIFTDVRKVVPGSYHAVVTLTAPAGETIELPIAFTVWESFRLSTRLFDTATTLDGGTDGPGTTLGLTGAQARWEVRDTPAWLRFDPAAGEGSRDVEVTCDKTAIASPGVLTAEVQVVDTVGGRAVPLSVRCVADTHRLLPARRGVAFSRFANAAALSADVAIAHNGSAAIDWSAGTTSSWLSVTPTGRSGEPVRITADPAGLAPGVHIGAVTVRSAAPTIARTETIRVGLYVSTQALTDPLVVAGGTSVGPSDPIRPYVYVMRDGPRIEARNLYTAAVEKVYPLPIPTPFMEICDLSDDGKYLYFQVVAGFDGSNPLRYYPREIWRVNLDDESEAPTLLFTERATEGGYSNGTFPVRYVSSNGVPLLFNPVGRLHRADTGDVVMSFLWSWTGTSEQPYEVYHPTRVSMAGTGKHMALAKEAGLSGDGVHLYSIHAYDAGPFAFVKLETMAPYQGFTDLGEMLLGGDLDRIYVRFGYFEKVDTAWVFHAKFRSEQRFVDAGHGVLFGAGQDAAGELVAGQYSKDGDLIRKLPKVSGVGWGNLLLSSDGLMLFAGTGGEDGAVYGFRR
jgi:hypothetical protein